MSENKPVLPSNMQGTERCTSPPISGVRKSSRLIKTSQYVNFRISNTDANQGILQNHQDSAASTSHALPSPTGSPEDNPGTSVIPGNTKETTATGGKSRNREPWDLRSENLFFDALKMYGKDYDSIRKYIGQKSKSVNVKNYEQIRNYYHNTASKVLAVLDLSEIDAPKEIKEVFVMVNYGEWKRKTNSSKLNAKTIKIFNEFVLNGWATVKVSMKGLGKVAGKNKLRTRIIRTPMCPVLRKFLDVGKGDVSNVVDTNVPKTVAVELSPNTQRDRAYVLSCWQNPFVRFVLNLNQPIADVLRWLQQKWIPQDLKIKSTVLGDDISNELPDIILYASPDMLLRAANLNPLGVRTTAMTTSANTSTISSGLSSIVNLGLRQCFGKGRQAQAQTQTATDQRHSGSPDKNDKKRRKCAVVPAEMDQQSVENEAKRFRAEITSPTPDEDGNPAVISARHCSDVGEGESSSDACVVMAAAAETDDEREIFDGAGVSGEQQFPACVDFTDSAKDKTVCRGKMTPESLVSQRQQAAQGIALTPDQLSHGISLNTCQSLTAGQLCLLCEKAMTIRLKYNITPKVTNSPIDPKDAWHFFINLVRADFVDTLHKKTPSQSNIRVITSNAARWSYTEPMAHVVDEGEAANVPVEPVQLQSALQLSDNAAVVTTQAESSRAVVNDAVFAEPNVGTVLKKNTNRRIAKKGNVASQACHRSVHPTPVANESEAFLAQLGQMLTKKPVVVNRRCTLVAPPIYSTDRTTGNQRLVTDRASPVVVNRAGADHQAVGVQQENGNPADAVTGVNPMSSLEESASDHAQAPHYVNTSDTLNTPDVSMMRLSPPSAHHTSEPAEHGQETGQSAEAIPQQQNAPQQDIIISDSFLDFSVSSFPSLGSKPMLHQDPIPNVIHALQLDGDDTALSSPPRPIRANMGAIHQTPSKLGFSRLSGGPSTSNLFSLLDPVGDNESSNTRNFFASCSSATTLETPEKCKDDDQH